MKTTEPDNDVSFWLSLRFKMVMGMVGALLFMLSAMLLVLYTQGYSLLKARENALAISAAQGLSGEIGQQLALAEGLATSIANIAEKLPRQVSLWREVLPNVIDLEQRSNLIAGGGVWPEPGFFAEDVRRRSFFWGRDPQGQLRYYEDYNNPEGPGYHNEEWYVPARYQRPGRCYWSRSYQDPYTGEPMVTCSVPMRSVDYFVGASTVDLRLSGLNQFVTQRGEAFQGYAFVLDRNDRFITRPGGHAGKSLRQETLAQLSGELTEFSELAGLLKKQHSSTSDAATQARAREMDAASPSIDAAEALLIANQLAESEEYLGKIEQHTLQTDAFLHQAVLVTTLTIPSAHWRLVVVQPMRVVHEAVMSVITRVMVALALVMVLIVGTASVWARSIILKPIQRLSRALSQTRPGALLAVQDAARRDEFGVLARIFNTYSSQLAASHEQLRASAEQFKSVTELQHDALMQIDDNGRIRSLNRRGEDMFGYREAEVLGCDFLTVLPWDPRIEALAGTEAAAQGSRSAKRILQLTAIRRDGSEFPADVSVSYWHGIRGGLYNVQVSDVTERRRAEEQVRLLATHDTLTGLPNRTLFNDRLEQATLKRSLEESVLAVLFLDLDHFKVVNDSLGHAIGDGLLAAVATRLKQCIESGDTVARIGGDEFAMLLPDRANADAAIAVANRVIQAIARPFTVEQYELRIGVSIGVTFCPNDDRDAQQLLRKADLAMYFAKSEGRNTYRFFTEQLRQDLLERKMLLDELSHAMDHAQLVVHYQPIVSLPDLRVQSVEALLRWQHPRLGLIGPDRFIPLAESTGKIVALGYWVISRAFADAKYLQDETGLPLRMGINLSLAQFRDPRMLDAVMELLARHHVDAEKIEFELTESVLMHDHDSAIATMNQLREIGVGLTIDDFGTGYSSLAHLKQFPVNTLKIDKSFVHQLATDKESDAICSSVVNLGHSLGLSVVAEGVESEADLRRIVELGCEFAQGFYFSNARAMPELCQWLKLTQTARPN